MAEEKFPAADPRGKLVLIVDDDDDIRGLLDLLIRKAGFKTLTATNGEEGIEKLAQKPDAVILDLIMPGCGGMGVINYLDVVQDPLPVIIVITAFQDQHPAVKAALQSPNVTQCLRKPIDSEMFLGALHRYLGTRALPENAA